MYVSVTFPKCILGGRVECGPRENVSTVAMWLSSVVLAAINIWDPLLTFLLCVLIQKKHGTLAAEGA